MAQSPGRRENEEEAKPHRPMIRSGDAILRRGSRLMSQLQVHANLEQTPPLLKEV